jgi:HrpA-like RNA helicase
MHRFETPKPNIDASHLGKDAIVNAVKENDSVVIIGEPGSGKTTRKSSSLCTAGDSRFLNSTKEVPQYLLDAGFISPAGLIAVTQPRKVAATTIATRVAAERSVIIGSEVGYSIRFEDKSSINTRIKFYTDGMLLREMLNDHALRKCDVVIVDEAHERTLRTDMLLANLKRVQMQRNQKLSSWSTVAKGKHRVEGKSLKIVVMSASLQADKFSTYLNKRVISSSISFTRLYAHSAPVLYVKGRQHPVRIFYTKEQQEDYLDSALRTFFQIHNEKEGGDVLIFLPGSCPSSPQMT